MIQLFKFWSGIGIIAMSITLFNVQAQQTKIDSLQSVLGRAKVDSNKVNALVALCDEYRKRDPKRGLEFGNQALMLANELAFRNGHARASIARGWTQFDLRNITEARNDLKRGLRIAKNLDDGYSVTRALCGLGAVERSIGQPGRAINYYAQAMISAERSGDYESFASSKYNVLLGIVDQGVREVQLQASLVSRERILRNAILGSVGLLLIVVFLSMKRMQGKKREASLRAEAAEYKAQAAEAEKLRFQNETERHRLESQQEFLRKLILSQEEERSRIAMGLHDQLGQDLVVIRNNILVFLKESCANPLLEQAALTAGLMLENVRRLARDLRPFQLDQYGLPFALAAMVERVGGFCSTNFILEVDPLEGVLDRNLEINIYRIVQESVNNIVRHADAKEAVIRIVRSEDLVELVIEDDGRGFSGNEESYGFGLNAIIQRVELLGGSISVQSSANTGTKIVASIFDKNLVR